MKTPTIESLQRKLRKAERRASEAEGMLHVARCCLDDIRKDAERTKRVPKQAVVDLITYLEGNSKP